MGWEHGLLLGIIGCTLTIVGFLIAYLIANHNYKKIMKKNRPLTTVEESLRQIRSLNGKYTDTE